MENRRSPVIDRSTTFYEANEMTPQRFPPPWSVEDIGAAF
jgi:hypothetical protein